MASKSKMEREKKLEILVAKYSDQRADLKGKIKNKNLPIKERLEAMLALDRLPKSSSKVKLNNRCIQTGNTRGYIRYFGLSRHEFKRRISRGEIPGLYGASW